MTSDYKQNKFYKSLYPKDIIDKASKIELLAFDVDGVLTDGGLYFDNDGNELKRFCAQDGHGIKIIFQEEYLRVSHIAVMNLI